MVNKLIHRCARTTSSSTVIVIVQEIHKLGHVYRCKKFHPSNTCKTYVTKNTGKKMRGEERRERGGRGQKFTGTGMHYGRAKKEGFGEPGSKIRTQKNFIAWRWKMKWKKLSGEGSGRVKKSRVLVPRDLLLPSWPDICMPLLHQYWRVRPYQHDSTASRLLSEVKHVRARLVLRWGTTLESRVLYSTFSFAAFLFFLSRAQVE